jgi:predicted lysophospholipase L1 biosynthesis ABC-type transport system permease subunit
MISSLPLGRLLKNPPYRLFRGAADEEESRPDQIGLSRERCLSVG